MTGNRRRRPYRFNTSVRGVFGEMQHTGAVRVERRIPLTEVQAANLDFDESRNQLRRGRPFIRSQSRNLGEQRLVRQRRQGVMCLHSFCIPSSLPWLASSSLSDGSARRHVRSRFAHGAPRKSLVWGL